MNLDAMQDILAASRREGKPMWQIVLETDMENRGVTARESLEKMAKTWRAMVEASDAYAGQRRSHSGLYVLSGYRQSSRRYRAVPRRSKRPARLNRFPNGRWFLPIWKKQTA